MRNFFHGNLANGSARNGVGEPGKRAGKPGQIG